MNADAPEGKLEFVVETDDAAVCHPMQIKLEGNETFAGLQVGPRSHAFYSSWSSS